MNNSTQDNFDGLHAAEIATTDVHDAHYSLHCIAPGGRKQYFVSPEIR
jgi:hypothetical protein